MEQKKNNIDVSALNVGIDTVLRYDTTTKSERKPQQGVNAKEEALAQALKLRGNAERQLSRAGSAVRTAWNMLMVLA